MLRHYWLKANGKSFSFIAGPKKKQFEIGAGVDDKTVRVAMIELGTINFQEDRGGGFRLIDYYKSRGERTTNLAKLVSKGLKPGDLMVWKRQASVQSTSFQGHVQTIQAIDATAHTLDVVQGNMISGVGVKPTKVCG